ncbi:MAG: sigma 54-interacting transcriptional regulator [Clostridia bacterium]|nr:sigma 54-interacting transcriptional regulator [Clostridia bacterium]
MAKVGILMPFPELKDLAESLVPEYQRITPLCIEYVQTADVRKKVIDLVEQGCEMIIARGLQARIARKYVLVPIVEMRASTKELLILIQRLKNRLVSSPGETCTVGIIGFFNMFHDMEQLGELLSVNLRTYLVTDIDQYPLLTERAVREGCSGVIGGEIVCRQAARLGIDSVFLSMGEESMREVLSTANLLCYANDLRKRADIELETMLNYTFTGIMQIDHSGTVQRVNRTCAHLIGRTSDELIGQNIRQLLPELRSETVQNALKEGRDVQAEVTILNASIVLINIAPILIDGVVDGAIITVQEEKEIFELDSKLRQEHFKRGFIPKGTFESMSSENRAYAEMLSQMKRISKYNVPVLLLGEPGVRKGLIAQSIHNASMQKGAFISKDCGALHPDDLDTLLFGKFTTRRDEPTIIEEARGGTLYLMHIEAMAPETQYKLLHLLRGWYEHNGPNQPETIDVRLIFGTEANLKELVRQGKFRHDLYYALSALQMTVPPLRERKEDIPKLFDQYLAQKQEKYGRNVHLTEDAVEFITGYSWPGNLDQLDNLCERLVLLSHRKIIDRATLELHIELSEPGPDQTQASRVVYMDPSAVALAELLRKNFGNREKTAAELGISKTTLWRRMKKYGLDRNSFI